MITHLFDLTTSTMPCRHCGGKRRANGAQIGLGALIQVAQAFLVEHAGCQRGDDAKRTLERAITGLAETL